MQIKRDKYLDKLIAKKGNGLIKIITGIRRCGKSYLLFNLFYDQLIQNGIPEDPRSAGHCPRQAFRPDEAAGSLPEENEYTGPWLHP